jgi:pseudouridine synthase
LSALIRLNRFLSSAGVASRRRCDEFIREGRVAVNGNVVTELGTRVAPSSDCVTIDGKQVQIVSGDRTLILHKPKNVLVAARDARGRKTVMDLLGQEAGRVFPVGRLDYRSEGLLVFTNDGELAFRLAHPRFKVEKIYRVDVEGSVSPSVVDALRRGVLLEDGPTQPAQVRVISRLPGKTVLEFILREGRKRQIRRMLALYGLPVERLVRTHFGPLPLGELAPGTWRALLLPEIELLRQAAGMGPNSIPDGAA